MKASIGNQIIIVLRVSIVNMINCIHKFKNNHLRTQNVNKMNNIIQIMYVLRTPYMYGQKGEPWKYWHNEIGETKSTHFIILAFSINETKKISAPTHA